MIADAAPADYFPGQLAACGSPQNLQRALYLHALPDGWEQMEYRDFLEKRRKLMARIIREAFNTLM